MEKIYPHASQNEGKIILETISEYHFLQMLSSANPKNFFADRTGNEAGIVL